MRLRRGQQDHTPLEGTGSLGKLGRVAIIYQKSGKLQLALCYNETLSSPNSEKAVEQIQHPSVEVMTTPSEKRCSRH